MADKGIWNVSDTDRAVRTVYVDIGPAQGPLVVYRIHNDGRNIVFAGDPTRGDKGGAAIHPGCDCDISGSPIQIGLVGFRQVTGSASGTYKLLCCQSVMPPSDQQTAPGR